MIPRVVDSVGYKNEHLLKYLKVEKMVYLEIVKLNCQKKYKIG